jgi:hypothetical protein
MVGASIAARVGKRQFAVLAWGAVPRMRALQMGFGALPAIRENVELGAGLFEDTLAHFADIHPGQLRCYMWTAIYITFRNDIPLT